MILCRPLYIGDPSICDHFHPTYIIFFRESKDFKLLCFHNYHVTILYVYVCKRFLVVKDTEMARVRTMYDRDKKCTFNISSKSQDLGKVVYSPFIWFCSLSQQILTSKSQSNNIPSCLQSNPSVPRPVLFPLQLTFLRWVSHGTSDRQTMCEEMIRACKILMLSLKSCRFLNR